MTSQDVRLEPSEAQSHTSFALEQLLGYAKAAGAAEADALLVAGADTQASMRLGEIEGVERSETSDIGLRVLIGRKQAIVSTSDLSPHALKQLAERAVDMARAAPDTPYVGLADTSELAQSWPQDLDLDDPRDISVEALQDLAIRAEESARAVSGVTNSEGASASASWNEVALATSNGFSGRYRATGYSLAVSVLAGDETTGMERDYDYSSNRHFSDLLSPERLGTSAGEKAVRRLHAKKPKSQKTTVVFDPRVGNSLIGHLAGALNGSSVARGSSFLKDDMGEQVLPDALSLIDDPHISRGLRSKPFDAEGLPNRRLALVEDGILKSWFLSLGTAEQLGMKSTGHATRGVSSPPRPGSTNLYLAGGAGTAEELIASVNSGIYVTELIGMGVNDVTGDYSRGAAGFLIENGKLGEPVNEFTIASNLKPMLRGLIAADDLEFRYGTNVPTLAIPDMMIAGQ